MHPRDAEGFEWEDDNVGHLARHNVQPWEAEEVFYNGPLWAEHETDDGVTWQMIGRTNAGRVLTLIAVTILETRLLRIFTGWDSPENDQNQYLGYRRSRRR